jgi:hypothetical protein
MQQQTALAMRSVIAAIAKRQLKRKEKPQRYHLADRIGELGMISVEGS